ncbi:MAG: dockerin type I domain-containing protein [Candidatus Zixiibacteriota bacterium]
MKKCLILSLILIVTLNISSFAGKVEEQLRKKGLHVADLTAEDEINLQVNKLQQAIQLQSIDDIKMILSPNYVETDPAVSQSSIKEKLEGCFTRFAQVREFNTQINSETGWKVTATQDFYIQNVKIDVQQDKAIAECDMGFYSAGKEYQKISEMLSFVFVERTWLLSASNNLFGFLEQASKTNKVEMGTPNWVSGGMRGTKNDFTSTSMLVPEILFHYNGDPVPRFNKTMSFLYFSYYDMSHSHWDYINIMNYPYGILADVLVTPGGSEELNHDFLFVSDVTSDKILATQMGDWIAEFGTPGGGQGQFSEPHGMTCSASGEFLVTETLNNRVSVYTFENGWSDPEWECNLTPGFNHPLDVEVKDGKPSQPPQDETRVVVADAYNHRLAFFHWSPAPLCFHRFYGGYGSGEGQFILPTAVCFGRNPQTGWQTDNVFVADYGNRRLVWLYITTDNVYWRATYQFPSNVDLTSVEVDNQGLVYVVDRRNGKVYKLAPSQGGSPYYFSLLGIWGETGTGDGQLLWPNTLTIAHGSYCPYPDPCYPLTTLGDVFVTESWGDQTGVRRFVIASDVVNLTAAWTLYNASTGEGNFIQWAYDLTDFAAVTEQVLHGAQVCTTYSRGSLNWGSQGGVWPVDGHPHATNYTVKITATSIYDPTIVVDRSVNVYVDTISTHNPVITQGVRCKHDSVSVWCNGCAHCIKQDSLYTIDVHAFDPDGGPLSYKWKAAWGRFTDGWVSYPETTTTDNYVCYEPPYFGNQQEGTIPEYIKVTISEIHGGKVVSMVYPQICGDSVSCICGDANANGIINAGDIVYLTSYLFRGGPPPANPIERGDANNSCVVDAGDIVYLCNYLMAGGPAPKCCWIH